MKKMLSVSTKTGDKGESGLANGERVGKDSLIFEVLGTQDELNSWIGLSLAKMDESLKEQKEFLVGVQNALFYIGAELAKSPTAKLKKEVLTELETASDYLQTQMEENWTTKFLFPGGNECAAVLDLTRAVSRRFERVVVRYANETEVSPLILQYVNRLSDYLYVLRCFVNQQAGYQEKKFERM